MSASPVKPSHVIVYQGDESPVFSHNGPNFHAGLSFLPFETDYYGKIPNNQKLQCNSNKNLI